MYEPIEPTGRKQLFDTVEARWASNLGEASEIISQIDACYAEIAKIEKEDGDVIPRGGRSKPDAVEIVEADLRLKMPEEVNGQVLKNEPSREAWLVQALADDPNAQAARARQADVQEKLSDQRKMIEGNRADLALHMAALAHLDAVLSYHSVPANPYPPTVVHSGGAG